MTKVTALRQQFLLHEMLAVDPKDIIRVPDGHMLPLNADDKYRFCFSGHENMDLQSQFIRHGDGDWQVREIPFSSPLMQDLWTYHPNPEQLCAELAHIFEEKGLHNGVDFQIMLTYPDRAYDGQMLYQFKRAPDSVMIAINSRSYHQLAMDMLEVLADPLKGMLAVDENDQDTYMGALENEATKPHRMVFNMATNARLNAGDVAELKSKSKQAGHYAFGVPLDAALGEQFSHVAATGQRRNTFGPAF